MMFAKPISLVLGAAALAAAAPTRRSTCSQPAGSKQYSCDNVWHPTDNSGWKFKVDEWQGTEPGVFADTNVAWTDGAMEMSVLDKGADWHDPSVSETCDCGYKQYSTALAVSEETYGYGYYEAKIQGGTPYHLGFWLQGDGLEINVVEFSQDKFYSNYHCFSSTDETGEDTKSGEAQDYAAPGAGEWVTYGVEYTAAALKFYRNGVLHDTVSPECLGGVADKLNVGFTHETNPDFGDLATGDAKVAIKDFMYWTDADADVAQGTTTDQPTTATESAFVPTCGQTVAGDDDSAYACSADADEMYNPAESEATTVDAATCCKALVDRSKAFCERLAGKGAQAVKTACGPNGDEKTRTTTCPKTCKDYLAFDATCSQTEPNNVDSPHKCSSGAVYDATKAAATTPDDATCCKVDQDKVPKYCAARLEKFKTIAERQKACDPAVTHDKSIGAKCAKSCAIALAEASDVSEAYCSSRVIGKALVDAKSACTTHQSTKAKCPQTCKDVVEFAPTCGQVELWKGGVATLVGDSPYKCGKGSAYDATKAAATTPDDATCCKELVDSVPAFCAARLKKFKTIAVRQKACDPAVTHDAQIGAKCAKSCAVALAEASDVEGSEAYCSSRVIGKALVDAKTACTTHATTQTKCPQTCKDVVDFAPTCGQAELWKGGVATLVGDSPYKCSKGFEYDATKAAATTLDDATCCKELEDNQKYCPVWFTGRNDPSNRLHGVVKVCTACKSVVKCPKSCAKHMVNTHKSASFCKRQADKGSCTKAGIARKCAATCQPILLAADGC